MASITTRAGKGSPLTNAEVDANFTNINTELGQKLVSSDLTPYLLTATAAATYQTIAGMSSYLTTSSASSTYLPLAGGNLTGTLNFNGSGLKITGDLSGAATTRLSFQTSTANGQTLVTAIPNGTGVNSQFQAYNSSDPANSSIAALVASASQVRIVSGNIGTGALNPITFIFSNTEAARFDPTTRNFLIGTSTDNTTDKLQVAGSASFTGDLSVTSTGAILVPAGTTAQRPAGTNGQLRYNSTTSQFEGYAGGAWGAIAGAGGTVTSITAGTGLSGGTITSSGTIALANTAVTAGSYTNANITVDAQGRITAASNGSGGGGAGGGTATTTTQFTATAGQTTFSVSYTAGQISVYMNGALLASADYTASNGTSVVLASGAAAGDIVTVVAYSTIGSAGSTGQVQYNNAGALAGSANMTFNGTRLSVADFADASLTAGRVTYAGTGGNLTDSANLTFDGTNLSLATGKVTTSAAGTNAGFQWGGTTTTSRLYDDGAGSVYLDAGAGASNADVPLFIRTKGSSGIIYFQPAGTNAYVLSTTGQVWSISGNEAMRLTSTGLGIGTSSPGQRLTVEAANPTNGQLALFRNSTAFGNGAQIFFDINNVGGAGLGMPSNTNALAFYVNGSTTERARITSGGFFGIGTSSPDERLTVAGAIRSTSNATNWAASDGALFDYFSGDMRIVAARAGANSSNILFHTYNAGTVAERARIDSSGNLGIGTTSVLGNSTVNAVLGFAARNSGATTGYFQTYNSNAGVDLKTWRWGGDGSGNLVFQTINDAYSSATQRMTLDASGSLLIGTTTDPTVGVFPRPPLSLKQFNSTAFASGIQIEASGDTSVLGIGYNGSTFQLGTSYRSTGAYRDISFAPGNTERARITSGGSVGINTTAPRVKLSIDAGNVNGVEELFNLHNQATGNFTGTSLTFSGYGSTATYSTWRYAGIKGLYDTTSPGVGGGGWGGQLRFFVNRGVTAADFADVMTISGGQCVGIGTTSPQAKFHISDTSNLYISDAAGVGWSGNPIIRNPANSGYLILMNGTTGGVGLTGGGTSWTSLSDERYKTDLVPIANGLQKVNQLRSVTGRFTTDEEGRSRSFLIAQDVQQVLPEAISVADDGRMMLSYTDTIPLLVAAIKELTAEVNALKAQMNGA